MEQVDEYFGIPEVNLHAAEISAKKLRKQKLYCSVPTRKQVCSLPYHELKEKLIGWMCHSPIEIIPSRAQIEEVKQILLERSDHEQLSAIITMCNYYIKGD